MNNRLLLLCSRPSTLNIKSRSARAFNSAAAGDASAFAEFPKFSSVSEICEYVESDVPSMDGQTLAQFLRYSSVAARTLPDANEFFRNSQAIRKIASTVTNSFSSEDTNTSVLLLKSLSAFAPTSRRNVPVPAYLKSAGDVFRNLLTSNKLSLSAGDFVTALKSLCRLDAKDLELCSLVEKNVPVYMSQMNAQDCRGMIEVLRWMDVPRQSGLYKMLSDKLVEKLDEFKNGDVIGCLITFANCDYIVAPAVKRCIELLTQHPSLFEASELVDAADALVKLNRFSTAVRIPILEEIQKRVRSLKVNDLCKTLDVLCNCTLRQSQLANEIIGLITSSSFPKNFTCEVSMAHAICSFNLLDRKSLLQSLISKFSTLEYASPNHLFKIVDIFESAKFDMDMRVELPKPIQTQLEHIYAGRKVDGFALTAKELLELLPQKYKLSVETGVRVGPFMPSLVDAKNKVVIEVQATQSPILLRRHLYEKLGYSAVFIPAFKIRSGIKEDYRIESLQFALDPAMVKLGRMTMEEMNARMESRRTAFA